MEKGTILSLIEEAEFHASMKKDSVMPSGSISMRDGYITIGDEPYEPTEWATGQFCNRLGIPARYYRRCPEHLKDANFLHWTQAMNKQVLLRMYGDRVRGFLSARYGIYDNDRFLGAVKTAIGDTEHRVAKAYLDGDKMMVEIIFTTITTADGPYGTGVKILNGEIGNASRSITPVVKRGKCDNSIVAAGEAWTRKHLGVNSNAAIDDLTVMMEIARCLQYGPEMIAQMLAAYKTPMPGIADVIEQIANRLEADDDGRTLIAIGTEGSETLGGLVNGLTSWAKSFKDPLQAARVEGIAGNILMTGKYKDWDPSEDSDHAMLAEI